MRRSYLYVIAVSLASLVLAACGRSAAQGQAAQPPPQVNVAQALARQVTESDEFTGRFEAVERVEVRPRVSGYIASVNFTEGKKKFPQIEAQLTVSAYMYAGDTSLQLTPAPAGTPTTPAARSGATAASGGVNG